jgi:hypothetical protein
LQRAEVAGARSRRRANADRIRIAIWDVNRAVPNLAGLAKRLTALQSMFVFEVVEMQAPIGTWRTETADRIPYLWAEKVAEKLSEKVSRIGAKRLLAITNLPLRDNTTLSLYGWSEDRHLSILSSWEVDVEGAQRSLERMIVNALQGVALAILLPRYGTHVVGVKACPMYYNDERNPDYISGRTKLCAVCRKELTKANHVDAIQALDAIADAF